MFLPGLVFFEGISTFEGPASNHLSFCQEFNVSGKLILVSRGKHGPVSRRSCHDRLPCGYMQRTSVGSCEFVITQGHGRCIFTRFLLITD